MPGLVGFVGDLDDREAQELLDKMAVALHHEDRYQADLFADTGIGLGRVTLGIVNGEPQPIWNEDRTLCIVMEGEVFDNRDLKESLVKRGYHFQVGNDAEFLLCMYEAYGERFAIKLNGAFLAAIWDTTTKRLTLVNDRLGLFPLYYAQLGDNFIFASGIRALLANPVLSRQVDLVAVAQYATFDHLLDDRTLLSEVRLLPPASILTYEHHQITVSSYWQPRYPEHHNLYDTQEYVQGLLFHLRQAIARQAPNGLTAGILLSGGLDSREVLGLLCEGPADDGLQTFTFGIPGCDDARFAKEVSARTNARHHFFELKPDYLLESAEVGIRLNDGLQNCVHMHTLPNLPAEADLAKVIYKGFLGDALLGYGQTRYHWANFGEKNVGKSHFRIHLDQGLVLFPIDQHDELFRKPIQDMVKGAVFESYQVALLESGARLAADQRHYFDLHYRVPRMTLSGVELVRSRAVVRMPFSDNDLVEYVLTIPPGLRSDRYLMKEAFVQAFPELARVPYTETGLPMVPYMRDLSIRAQRQARWRLRAAGLKWVSIPQKRPYADYNNWMRTVLKDWVKSILLSPQFMDRGYFNPDYVSGLVDEHMTGANHDSRLGVLLTLELWHRQFID